jgi:hypothetical protein
VTVRKVKRPLVFRQGAAGKKAAVDRCILHFGEDRVFFARKGLAVDMTVGIDEHEA